MHQSQIVQKNDFPPDEVLDRKATSRLIGVCLTTLSRLDIPRIKIRRRVLYKRSVIMDYLDSKTELTHEEASCNQY